MHRRGVGCDGVPGSMYSFIKVNTSNLLSLTKLLEWQLNMFACVLFERYVLTVYTGETKIKDTYLPICITHGHGGPFFIQWSFTAVNMTVF